MNLFKSMTCAGVALAIGLAGTSVSHAQSPVPDKNKVSKVLGFDIGNNLRSSGVEIDPAVLAEAIKAALSGEKSPFNQQETAMTLQAAFSAAQAKKAEAAKAKLEAFGKEEGVTKTASGLMYKVVKEGKGDSPKATDKVKVHYHGTLLDGTVFDSSVERGQPAEFPLNRVIPGWTEGLQLMKPGAKFTFVIPSDLAYGPRGSGRKIPPNTPLRFEVELLEVLGSAPAPAGSGTK